MRLVQSVERSFELLEVVAGRPAGISELARRVDLPTSTVARLLKTLEKLRAVQRDERGVHSLGPSMLALAARAGMPSRLHAVDHDQLDRLANRLGEIVGVSVRDGRHALYLAQSGTTAEIQVRDWTGERIPLHAVSSGLLFLAHADPADVDDYLDRDLERFTEHTVSDPARIGKRLTEVRRLGYAWTRGEFHPSINSVAAPLFDADGEVVGAVHSHGPSYRFPPPDREDEVVAALTHTATQLSHAIDWNTTHLSPVAD